MKLSKKISALTFAAVMLAGSLAGCGSKTDPNQELVDAAAGAIVFSGYTQVTANILAPKYVTKEGQTLEVTYKANTESVTVAPWDDTRVKLIYTRPAADQPAEAYTLTGTVSYEGKTASKELSGYIMPLPEGMVVSNDVDAIVEAYKAAGTKIQVQFTGLVDNIISSGYYWVKEDGGEDHMYVYKSSSADDVKLGDKVQISGSLTKYYSQYEFESSVAVDILSRGNDYSRTATAISAADLYAINDSDYKVLGKLYNVDLKVVVSGKYINFQAPDDATKAFQGYSITTADAAKLTPYADKVVNIDVVFYTTNNHRVTYAGSAITEK
ncbi:MAG: hypothetical protein WC196_01800 [Bacilli bacterium]|nr:hypothetical protein [Bacilli bacterium]MDD3422151.1 hypothetical protein [Bacilli bacterium]MDD4065461.1 hypothetical protein [Bacilli bacterium]